MERVDSDALSVVRSRRDDRVRVVLKCQQPVCLPLGSGKAVIRCVCDTRVRRGPGASSHQVPASVVS